MAAPSGTARDIIQRLNTEANRVLQQPDVREKLAAQGADPIGGGAEQSVAYVRSEIAKWARVVQASGIKAE